MIVLDGSATIEWLQRRPLADAVERRLLAATSIHVPHLWFLEIAQVLRRHVLAGAMTATDGGALLDLADQLRADRHPHEPLGPRIWDLRDNLTAYDATYVALAEAIDARLVTTDAVLARSPGHRARMDLVA